MRAETRAFEIFPKGEGLGQGTEGVQGRRHRHIVIARDVQRTTTSTYRVRADGHILDPVGIVER